MRKFVRGLLIALTLGLSTGIGLAQDTPAERPFRLGFTPFPHEISVEAVRWSYARIAEDADLIVHHFDNGVPWTEALAGTVYHQQIQDDWAWRRANTPEGHALLVTVTPINFDRTGLAAYRGAEDDMPLPAPFDGYSFDHPDVTAAYLRYCQDIIDYFKPDYFMFGIEVNLLMKNRPGLWASYLALHQQVYAVLRAFYPDLPLFVSVTGFDLLEGYTDANHADQVRALTDILPHTDMLGLSLYAYLTAYMTSPLPDDMFDRLAALTDKPIAVTETGYPAQDFAVEIEDGTQIEFVSDADRQAAYITLLLDAAQANEFVFVVNFVVRDYDTLWEQIGGQEDITILWRDTGLYDEAGHPRPALDIWRAALARPLLSGR